MKGCQMKFTLPATPFFIALQFLTTLPIGLKEKPDEESVGRSGLYYPLAGAVIGLKLIGLMAVLDYLLPHVPPLVMAALILILWVGLTGALHLDGLADSLDALAGGIGDRKKTLAIMKDPYLGPMGASGILLVLLLKFACLSQLAPEFGWQALLLAPVGGRMALLALFLTTPYVRKKGLGAHLAALLPRKNGWRVIILFTFLGLLTGGEVVVWLSLALPALLLWLRSLMMSRLGGTTGDSAGAVTELSESLILLAFAIG